MIETTLEFPSFKYFSFPKFLSHFFAANYIAFTSFPFVFSLVVLQTASDRTKSYQRCSSRKRFASPNLSIFTVNNFYYVRNCLNANRVKTYGVKCLDTVT